MAEQCLAHLLWAMLYRLNTATNIAKEAYIMGELVFVHMVKRASIHTE